MAQATADFELGTNGNAVLTTDAGSATAWDSKDAAGNAITYDNAHVYGTLAGKYDATGSPAGACAMVWSTGIGTLTDWYGRTYLYATGNPSGNYRVCGDINGNFPIFITSTGIIQMLDQGGLAVQTAASIGLNQWVRIEYHWLNSLTVGQVEVKLFNNPDSASPTETQTSAANRNTSASTTSLFYGLGSGGSSAGPIWLDNIVAGATSYPGPFITASANFAPVIYGRGAA